MENQKLKNRLWITLNLISLIALIVFFYLGKFSKWQIIYISTETLSIALFITSFYLGFIKTNFWKLVHSKSQNLDEREISVVLTGLKYSYSTFTILCIGTVYIFAFMDFQFIDVVFAAGLLYLAHILPAAVVGWNEKNIETKIEYN
jgi:hypothetical protein